MPDYKTPGVFVEEINILPPSVAPVATAIPAFIGFTEKRHAGSAMALRVNNLLDFHTLFGGPYIEPFSATVDLISEPPTVSTPVTAPSQPTHYLYYQLRMYFLNGGGPCYIVSVATYGTGTPAVHELVNQGITALERVDEPTVILIPDALKTLSAAASPASRTRYYGMYQQALGQCSKLKDRFTLIDTHSGAQEFGILTTDGVIGQFRSGIGTNDLSYGAVYYPWLATTINYAYRENKIEISGTANAGTMLHFDTTNLESLSDDPDGTGPFASDEDKRTYYENRSLFHINNLLYATIREQLEGFLVVLPPSGAIAGVYAQVDRTLGVFKSPANTSLVGVIRPMAILNKNQTDELNVHPSGKSVNVIRPITGRGNAMVMGARTLEGNSNEWRYISVRRFFLFAEESIKKSVEAFVFEPNTPDTWNLIRGLIENFLNQQWIAGALTGATASQAFFVRIGQGETMSAEDVLNGRLILEVGLAVVRPAEFIILKFMHQLQTI